MVLFGGDTTQRLSPPLSLSLSIFEQRPWSPNRPRDLLTRPFLIGLLCLHSAVQTPSFDDKAAGLSYRQFCVGVVLRWKLLITGRWWGDLNRPGSIWHVANWQKSSALILSEQKQTNPSLTFDTGILRPWSTACGCFERSRIPRRFLWGAD